jgi:energy-coupling factor transporter ATP-binding protein EcfA2
VKIDLHCHTKKVKRGDSSRRNVDAATFRQAVENAGVEIVAITNHNVFDLAQYEEFSTAAKGVCSIWPGVELDMSGDHEWHLLVICNPSQVQSFARSVTKLVGSEGPESVSLKVGEVTAKFAGLDVLYIPHAHGKRSGRRPRDIPDAQREELEKLVENPGRIIFEPHHHSLGVLSKNGYRVILGSDVQDWSQYSSCNFSDLRFPICSFTSFCKLVEGNIDTYNDTVLNSNECKTVSITPVDGAKSRTLTIYKGVNVVFGQKGTGKSKIIDALDTVLSDSGLDTGKYQSRDARNQYEKELIPNWDKCSADRVNASDCMDSFQTISQWKEVPIARITDYIEYAKNTDASRNRRRLVIADVGKPEHFGKEAALKSSESDLGHLLKAESELSKIDIESYLGKDGFADLNSQIELLKGFIREKHRVLLVEKYALQLLQFSIESIKSHAESLCGAPSSPNGMGFYDFVENRIRLKRSCDEIIENVDGREVPELEPFGTLEGKGPILMETTYLMLKDANSEAKCFNGRKKKLVDARTSIANLGRKVWEPSLSEAVKATNEKLRAAEVSSSSDFVGARKRTVIEGRGDGMPLIPYEPSDGELAIIMIRRFLSEEHDVYLLDEPERGMGNSYIDSNIRPDIVKLADNRKSVVVATHNANLAIRTMPVFSYLTEYHESNDYALYAGSPYSNVLTSLDNTCDTKSWSATSMEILEGGEEAFYDRKDMYELDR